MRSPSIGERKLRTSRLVEHAGVRRVLIAGDSSTAMCVSKIRRTKNVVLAVRGTLSITDCMTDVLAREIDLATVSCASRTPKGGIARGPVSLLPSVDENEEEEDDDLGSVFGQLADGARAKSGTCIVPPEDGEGEHFAHEGIFRAAAAIEQDVARHGLLEQLLLKGRVDQNDHFKVDDDWQNCREYGLVLTGHSLGAGTAALLAMLLRPIYGERVHCWAYSPPGGLLSENTAKLTRSYVTSVVVGHDIIPRLGVRTMEQLRDHSLELLMHSDANKNSIICGALCGCKETSVGRSRFRAQQLKMTRATDRAAVASKDARSRDGDTRSQTDGCCKADDIEDGAHSSLACSTDRDNLPQISPAPSPDQDSGAGGHLSPTGGREKGSKADAWLKKRENALRRQTDAKKVVHARRMFLPGRVLHLTNNQRYGMFASYDGSPSHHDDQAGQCMCTAKRGDITQGYSPWWIQDPDTFQEILVDNSMFVDHMPDRVMRALQSVEIVPGKEPGHRHTVPQATEWSTADRADYKSEKDVSAHVPLQVLRQHQAATVLQRVHRGNSARVTVGRRERRERTIRTKGLTIALPEDAHLLPRP